MNFGRPIGTVGRWFLKPIGWPTILFAVLGAITVASTIRTPVKGSRFSFIDFLFYARFWEWKTRQPGMTFTDLAFTIGLASAALAIVIAAFRTIARQFAVVLYRPAKFQRPRILGRLLILLLISLVTVLGIGSGWPYRAGQRWAWMAINSPPGIAAKPPHGLSQDEQIVALHCTILNGPSRKSKVAAIKILISTASLSDGLPIILDAIARESDSEVKVLETRLLGFAGTPSSVEKLLTLMEDSDPAVREAAADSLGIIHHPAWPQRPGRSDIRTIASDPPIVPWRGPSAIGPQYFTRARAALERTLTGGATSGERHAAARALAHWPHKTYDLRYAEWGVFMADAKGKMQFVREQLAEIPPFVHRIGNPANDMQPDVHYLPMPVWKPVIHLTADKPIAVDLEVSILDGRPWVVYPRFADFVFIEGQPQRSEYGGSVLIPARSNPSAATKPGIVNQLGPLDPTDMPTIANLGEGYPWLSPHHRVYDWWNGSHPPSSLSGLGGVGVLWQGLIVTPTRLDWMQPAAVPADPRFAWWNRLRQVDSSWVSSQNESERFLYYDGPTLVTPPIIVTATPDRLNFSGPQYTNYQWETPAPKAHIRTGLYIDVCANRVAWHWFELLPQGDVPRKTSQSHPSTTSLETQFLEQLRSRGLNHSEAQAMTEIWSDRFFKTPGQRFLLFMTQRDYDFICPMTMRPAPTSVTRVGIQWTEWRDENGR